ncbi:MAG: hybrid sensor histidine kinase/response regulator [Burkholderiales bacterium]
MSSKERNALSFAENRILIEQLRLIYASMTASVLPMFPAILLLLWVLENDANRLALVAWASVISAANVHAIFFARAHLARGLATDDAPRLARTLVGYATLWGTAWGLLAIGTLGTTTPIGTSVAISVLAGIVGGSLSMLSPILAVFTAFSVPLVGLTVVALWLLDDPAYNAFAVISVLYLGVLIAQSRNSALASRATIELRFENIELIRRAEAARIEAEEANLAKSKFLAAAGHDLRQPIHAQGLFLDVLSRTDLDTRQRELVTHISAASDASIDMLNTLLDFSRIEAGVIVPKLQTFRLQHFLNLIEREFEPQADGKGLAYRSRETALEARSDPAILALILRNLVSNAIRYTDHGGVLVACRRRGGHAVLEVWDTGMGIAVEQQAEIFKEFHQLGNPERDRRKGLGLGLAIAQGLARTLGHDLSLASTPQRGSVFRLALPIASQSSSSTSTEALTPPASARPIATRSLNARVLLIDDEEAVRSGMLALLQDWGCTGVAAETIDEAVALAGTFRPDVVISDYRLRAQSTGLEAITAVRAHTRYDLPAVLITGDTASERLREALSSGVPLLHKPVSPRQLYLTLTELLGNGGGTSP